MTEEKRIPIETASIEDLRAFGEAVLGLELDGRATAESIRNKYKTAGYRLDTIPAAVSEMTSTRKQFGRDFTSGLPTFTKTSEETGEPIMDPDTGVPVQFCRINVPISSRPGGDRPVYTSVNGRAMLIPRGKDVDVPEKFVEVLMNAEELSYEEYNPELNMFGGLPIPSVVKAYPFSTVQRVG